MILRHLRYFSVVAQEGSVGRAAKVLRVAQPALSRLMQRLEREVGFALFEREPRGIRITAAGEVILRATRNMLDAIASTVIRARRSAEGQLGMIRIGLARSPMYDARVGTALARLRADYPDVAHEVTEIPSYRQAESLLTEEVDVAIGIGAPSDASESSDGIWSAPLYDERINAVLLPAEHPLARRALLRPADLRSERLLAVDPRITSMFDSALRELDRLGLMRNVELHRHVETLWNMVAAGRGWAIAGAGIFGHPPAGTVAVPLRGFDVRMNVLVRRRAADDSRLTANVVSLIMRAVSGEHGRGRTPAAPMRADLHSADVVARNVELRALRALLAAVEEQSVSEAARRLRLTQSAVSRQIHSLEEAFGLQLLTRDANGVSATRAGAIVADDAYAAIVQFEHALLEARRVDRGYSGVCKVGSVPTELTHNVLVAGIRAVANLAPTIAVEVTELSSPRQPAALHSGEIDIGLAMAYAGPVNDRSIASLRIVDDVFDSALLAATHPLATRAWLRPEELEDIPFLFIARHAFAAFYDAVIQQFDQIGLRPRIDASYPGTRALWRVMSDGYGWTVGPRSARTQPIPGIVAVPIEGFVVPGGLDLLWRRNESNTAVLTVLDAFRTARLRAPAQNGAEPRRHAAARPRAKASARGRGT